MVGKGPIPSMFTKPILTMIKTFDKNMPCLEEVYENINNMLERIREIIKANESDSFGVFYNEVKDIVTKR
jgi:hypothetical protein